MGELFGQLQRGTEAGRLMPDPVGLADAPAAIRTALVGASREMQDVCKETGQPAAKPVTVLIRSETGAGKDLIARAISQHSTRTGAPFIAIGNRRHPHTRGGPREPAPLSRADPDSG